MKSTRQKGPVAILEASASVAEVKGGSSVFVAQRISFSAGNVMTRQ